MAKEIAIPVHDGELVTYSNTYKFKISYPLFSKARPRLTRKGHAYMPADYKTNQRNLRLKLVQSWPYPALEGEVHLQLILRGEGRGDLDNIAGAFMDCANGVLWRDDNCKIVSGLSVAWVSSEYDDSSWEVTLAEVVRSSDQAEELQLQ